MSMADIRAQSIRQLIEAGATLASTDKDGSVNALLAARQELVSLGLMEQAAAVVMDAVAVARQHKDRELAARLCRRAARDDPRWAGPVSTLALVEVELANRHAEAGEFAKALALYARAARNHGRAAKLLAPLEPSAAETQMEFRMFALTRRKAVGHRARGS